MGSLGCGVRPQAPLFARSMNTGMPLEARQSCCGGATKKRDWFLWISFGVCTAAILVALWDPAWLQSLPRLRGFCHSVIVLFGQMWWGLALGILAIGTLSHVPREWISAALGRGIWRALCMGLLFDLCSHGILMVGAKLYERGASIGQTMAFLIASPWNSFSLTLILVGLIGLPWTLAFILLSALVGLITGTLADRLVKLGRLPGNPQHSEPSTGFSLRHAIAERLGIVRWRLTLIPALLLAGLRESGAIVRWLLLGVILASLLRVWVSDEMFSTWFGATWAGLALTMLATTFIEICSEGSSPIAADLLNRAGAPGNAFAFLMGGIATDYTEIVILHETTRSWKLSFALPLLTIPQVVAIGLILNHFATH